MPYGDTARSWDDIVAFYERDAQSDPAFSDLATLATRLAASGFPAAGLRALTSMHDLILGPSSRVLDNPHLVISYDFPRSRFRLEYRDGGPVTPWSRTALPGEVYEVVERFLTRRARWFRVGRGVVQPNSALQPTRACGPRG